MSKINTLNLFYNPFKLSTATTAWNNTNTPTAVRLFNTVRSAAYDIYINNPYKLTIGNVTKIAKLTTPLTLTQKIASGALISLASCYSAVLYGLSIYSIGGSLHSAGELSKIPILKSTATKISSFGENLFLAGAVPIYAVGYAFPKFLIQNTPKALHQIIVQVNKAVLWIFSTVLMPLWKSVLLPAFQAVHQAMSWSITKLNVALKAIATSVARAASWVFVNIISPVSQATYRAIRWTMTKLSVALKAIAASVAKAASWVFVNIISPISLATYRAIRWTMTKLGVALKAIATSIARAASWVFINIISPALQTTYQAIRWTMTKLGTTLKILATSVTNAANWIFTHVISPVFHITYQAIRWSVLTVVSAINAVATYATKAAYWIFIHTIAPIFQAIYAGGLAICRKIAAITMGTMKGIETIAKYVFDTILAPLAKGVQALSHKVSNCIQRIFQNTIVPLVQAVKGTFYKVGTESYRLFETMQNSLADLFARLERLFNTQTKTAFPS